MIVHKFGGTSVGDAQCFANVADILAEHHLRGGDAANGQVVVVVSAMSGVTDRLIAGARAAAEGRDTEHRQIKAQLLSRHLEVVDTLLTRSPERLEVGGLIEDRLHELERFYRSIALLGELTPRGHDAVASFGEQLSASILAAALRERGVRAVALSATDLIVTDDNFGAATPLMALTRPRLHEQVRPLVERGMVPIITGYIAATEKGVPTTLGRGGSDFAAAIIGAGLDADEVWIWSDVDGILTADPNIVPQAQTLSELSYTEAADLAYYGAEVLHPQTIRPLIEQGIPLRIVNSFNPGHPGTRIVESPRSDRERLPAIISTTGLSLIGIGSQDDSWALPLAARALQRLSASRRWTASSRMAAPTAPTAWAYRNGWRPSRSSACPIGTKAALSPTLSPPWGSTGRGSSPWPRPRRSTASPFASPRTRFSAQSAFCITNWDWRNR